MSDWIRSSVLGLRVVWAAINLANPGSFVRAVALGTAWGHILLHDDTRLRLNWIAAQGQFLWRTGRLMECSFGSRAMVGLGGRRIWGLGVGSIGI